MRWAHNRDTLPSGRHRYGPSELPSEDAPHGLCRRNPPGSFHGPFHDRDERRSDHCRAADAGDRVHGDPDEIPAKRAAAPRPGEGSSQRRRHSGGTDRRQATGYRKRDLLPRCLRQDRRSKTGNR
ncbi:MAG: hypothetical protein MZV64_71195 [Ignavibacteriales bacterium]|nr:hypothetical protein [Ignavibacteriales bacterium]